MERSTYIGALYYYFSILDLKDQFVAVLGLQPEQLTICFFESIDPHKQGHSFAERPPIITE